MAKGNPNPSPKGQFKPGQSGNPGGRKKGPEIFRKLFDERGYEEKLLNMWAEIAFNPAEKTADRSKAGEILMERRFGKVPMLNDEGEVVGPTTLVVQMCKYEEPKE